MLRGIAVGALAAILGAGCSVRGPQDGPGERIDASAIPDVVPRDLPKSQHGNPDSYVVAGKRYHVRDSAAGYVEVGKASWYGSKFHGRRTSSGDTYDMYALTAAHRTLPLPTFARVTNLENGKSLVVKINDRGPFHDDRIIDLSYAAATRLDVVDAGTARVRVRALTPENTAMAGGASSAESAAAGGGADGPPMGAAGGSGDGDGVYVQVGAFSRFANAQEMRARVQGADIRGVEVQRGETADGDRIYRVRIGPLADLASRRSVLSKLRRAGIGPARVVAD